MIFDNLCQVLLKYHRKQASIKIRKQRERDKRLENKKPTDTIYLAVVDGEFVADTQPITKGHHATL